ncbi:MAG: DHHA1 domain-containing protein, partial [Luteibaculum sp.]
IALRSNDYVDQFKTIATELKNHPNTLGVLLGNQNDKAILFVSVGKNLLEKGYSAKEVIKKASNLIKGGGGGQDFLATAGGKDTSKFEEVLQLAEAYAGSSEEN